MNEDLSPSLSRHQPAATSGMEPMLGIQLDKFPNTRLKTIRRFLHWLGRWQQPILIRQLESRDPTVRERAVRNLRVVGDRRAVLPLLKMLDEETNPQIRLQVVRSLGRIGDHRAVPALMKIITEGDEFRVCLMALYVLGEMRVPTAIPTMLEAMNDPLADVRRIAISALGASQTMQAVPAVAQALEDEDAIVRWLGVHYARQFKDERTIGGLIFCLNDPEPQQYMGRTIAEAASAALKEIGTPEALRALERKSRGGSNG